MAASRRTPRLEVQILLLAEEYEALTTGQRGTKMSSLQAGQEVVKRAEGRYDSLIVGGFKKAFGGEANAAGALRSAVLSKTFPHGHDTRLHLGREFFVRFFRCR